MMMIAQLPGRRRLIGAAVFAVMMLSSAVSANFAFPRGLAEVMVSAAPAGACNIAAVNVTLATFPVLKNVSAQTTIVKTNSTTTALTLWGLSPCNTWNFDAVSRNPTSCPFMTNVQQFDSVTGECSASFDLITATTQRKPLNWDPAAKVLLALYAENTGLATKRSFELAINCAPDLIGSPVLKSATMSGLITRLTFDSWTVCPNAVEHTTAAPTKTTAPTDAPRGTSKISVSWSVVVGGCVLGVAFIAMICILRKWALEHRRHSLLDAGDSPIGGAATTGYSGVI